MNNFSLLILILKYLSILCREGDGTDGDGVEEAAGEAAGGRLVNLEIRLERTEAENRALRGRLEQLEAEAKNKMYSLL